MACSEWNVPWAPVKPWQMTFVFLSTRTAISGGLLHGLDHLLGGVGKIVGRENRQAGFGEDLLPELNVRALEPDHQRHVERHFARGGDDAFRDHVAAHDAAEDVD